jgi:hypothetical protein
MSGGRKFAVQLFCSLLALPIFYVTSSGPMLRVAIQYRVTAIWNLYQPLVSGAMATGLEDPLMKYWDWWSVAPPGVHRRYYTPPATPVPK